MGANECVDDWRFLLCLSTVVSRVLCVLELLCSIQFEIVARQLGILARTVKFVVAGSRSTSTSSSSRKQKEKKSFEAARSNRSINQSISWHRRHRLS